MPPVVFAAVAGAIAAAGTAWAAGLAVTFSVVATGAAISAGLAAAQMVLAPKQKPFRQELTDRGHSVRQPISPRQIVYGRVKTGGPIIFLQSTANHLGEQKNKWLQMVIPLAAHEVDAIEDVYFDGEVLPLGPDGAVTGGKYFDAGWNIPEQRPRARVWKHLGQPGQVADARLVSVSGGKWTANHIGTGIAYLYVELEYTASIYTNGIPNVTAIVRGKKVHDPRTGQTVWSDNAALCIRDYLMLSNVNGGVGATEDEFDQTNVVAAANLCDELIPLDAGGTERRYTLNGTVVLSTSNTPRNTLESMLTACGGSVIYTGGKWRILPAAFRSPTVTLTDVDLRAGVTIQTRVSHKDVFTGVKGQYSSPANLWQPADYPPVQSDVFVAEIGGEPVWKDIDRPYTVSAATAQRLAKIDILKVRQPITVTLPCKLTAFRVQAGDVVRVTLPRLGWTDKNFEVVEWLFAVGNDGTLGCDLSLRETDPSIFDFLTSEEQAADPAPNTSLPDWTNVGPPRNLSVDSSASQIVTGSDGTLISRALVTWERANDEFVERYEIHWRRTGETDWSNQQPVDGISTANTFSYYIDNMPVGVSIDVRVRSLNGLGVPSNFITVTGHVISGTSTLPNPVITGLKVVGSAAGSPGLWNAESVTFTWNEATGLGSLFDAYVITIKNIGGTVRRVAVERGVTFTYDYAMNATDGLVRSFIIEVQARTKLPTNNLSVAASLTASNPVPALPTAVSLAGDFRTISMRYTPPNEPDFAGVLVWRSETTGFTPAAGNLVYPGGDPRLVVIPAEPGKTYYVRYAAYDLFGQTGLTVSGEVAVSTVRISHADLADEIIETSNLIPALNTQIAKIPIIETAVSTETTARQNADTALASQITTVAAQLGGGFNSAVAWYFDTTAEGWTATNAAIAWQAGGAIRVTPSSGDPQIVSPVISVSGALNRFVRLKITRVSGSTSASNHQVYFATSGHSYSESHTKTIAVGTIAIGESKVLTFDMQTAGDWATSTITRLRFDPINATDVFDVDWIAIGTDAPAASTALVQQEATARATADTANADLISTVQTTVNGHTSSIQTAATSINGLESQYTVKVQTDGYVSGYGLASTVRDGTPTSSFVVSADRFAIAQPVAPGKTAIGATIPFIVTTKGSTPILSFDGHAYISKLLTGTLDTELLYVGGSNMVLDGPNRNIRVNNGTVDLVKMGQISPGVYGFEAKDTAGNLIMSSGAGLAAGTVKATALAIGQGVNLLYNSDFQYNLDGWGIVDNTTGQTLSTGRNLNASNTIPGLGLAHITAPLTPANGTNFTLNNWGQLGQKYPVIAGRRYEAHALIGQYRAGYVQILLSFYDAAGVWISNAASNAVTNTTQFIRLGQLGHALVFATAPANAVTAMMRLLVQCNGGTNPYGMITRAYLGEAATNQTEASPWVPGPTPLATGGVSGLGGLATRNSVNPQDGSVTGLGSLATQNNVAWASLVNVPAFGNFAYLGTITAANISTYIQSAAIGQAYISEVNAAAIRAGMIDALDINVRWGSINVIDSNNANRVRMKMGHVPGYAYGFYCYDSAGTVTFEASGARNYMNGAIIGDLSVGTLKLANEAVMVPRSVTTTEVKQGNGAFQKVIEFNITVPQQCRLMLIGSLSQSFPSGNRSWIVRAQVYFSDGRNHLVDRNGGAWNDAIALSTDVVVPAGTHTCVMYWMGGDSTVRFNGAHLVAMGAMR